METAFETILGLGQLSHGTNDERFPQRPSFGKEGRVTTAWTNYVEMGLNPRQTLWKFDIQVELKAEGRKFHRVIQLLLQQPFLRSIPHFTDLKSTLVVETHPKLKGIMFYI